MSLRGTTLLGRRMSCPTYPLFSPSRGADGSPTCARVDAWRFQFAAGGVNSGRQPWRDLSAGGPHLLSVGDATAKPLRHCLGWNISTATGPAPSSQQRRGAWQKPYTPPRLAFSEVVYSSLETVSESPEFSGSSASSLESAGFAGTAPNTDITRSRCSLARASSPLFSYWRDRK